MADANSSDSPLEAATGAAGSRAVEAFSVLGNETRLSILLALWEAYEPYAEDNAVPFTDLRERVGIRDSGNFNYHLGKLEGHFIRKTDDGYELRRAGHQLVRTVIAGTGIEEPSVEPSETDKECPICGAPAAITHQNAGLYLICTECEGQWEEKENQPSGILAGGDFDPAGLTDRTPDQMWDAMLISLRHAFQSGVKVSVMSAPLQRISL